MNNPQLLNPNLLKYPPNSKYPYLYHYISQLPFNVKDDFLKTIYESIDKTKFSNYMKNKKVVIIAPSPSVREIEEEDNIENNFDIIVRINKGWKHSSSMNKYIGRRTDVLYNCMDPDDDSGGLIDIEYVLKNKLKFIIDPIRKHYNDKNHRDNMFHGEYRLNNLCFFHKYNNNRIPFDCIDSSLYEILDQSAQTRLNTGLAAIIHILSFDIKLLYIKGFTFLKDGYIADYRNEIYGKQVSESEYTKYVLETMNYKGTHNQEKQIILFKKIYEKHKDKILITNAMKKILNE